MLDEQFIRIMGSRLDRFKPLSKTGYQCRCPVCGDSKKDKKKARGNFYVYKGTWLYKCHNCGVSMRIPTMLDRLFPDLFDEYIMGKTRQRMTERTSTAQKAKNNTTQKTINRTTQNTIIDLPKLSELPEDHPAVTYMLDRKLPTKYFNDLYYAEQFKKWSVSIVPGAFSADSLKYDDARIVIPFRDKEGRLFAFQGRALKKSKLKYLTVKIDQDKQKIYGLNFLKNPSKKVLVVEGPIDSMFLENCIGTADSSLDTISTMFENPVFIWDNEPRSLQIVKKMEKAINDGQEIVIWKKSNSFNDINDAVQNFGYSIDAINKLVNKRIYKGLEALLELNNWRKC